MWRILQALGRRMTATQFRRAAEVWIFRAPSPWVVGPRPHYLVNEAQKTTIEAIVGVGHIIFYLLAAVAVAWFVFYPAAFAQVGSCCISCHCSD